MIKLEIPNPKLGEFFIISFLVRLKFSGPKIVKNNIRLKSQFYDPNLQENPKPQIPGNFPIYNFHFAFSKGKNSGLNNILILRIFSSRQFIK